MGEVKDTVFVKVDEVPIASISRRDDSYCIHWQTEFPDSVVIHALRSFYNRNTRDFGESYRRMVGKLFHSVDILWGPDDRIFQMTLDDFLAEDKFQEILGKEAPLYMRVNTPYADLLYDLERSKVAETPDRHIQVISHLDLSSQLPYLIQITNIKGVPLQAVPKLRSDLKEFLGVYGR